MNPKQAALEEGREDQDEREADEEEVGRRPEGEEAGTLEGRTAEEQGRRKEDLEEVGTVGGKREEEAEHNATGRVEGIQERGRSPRMGRATEEVGQPAKAKQLLDHNAPGRSQEGQEQGFGGRKVGESSHPVSFQVRLDGALPIEVEGHEHLCGKVQDELGGGTAMVGERERRPKRTDGEEPSEERRVGEEAPREVCPDAERGGGECGSGGAF